MASNAALIQNYFQKFVFISSDQMETAKRLLQEVVRDFKLFLSNSELDCFEDPIFSGSAFEGLKVIKTDEFDLLLPLKMLSTPQNLSVKKETLFDSSKLPVASVYYYIQRQLNAEPSSQEFKSKKFDIETCYRKASDTDSRMFLDQERLKQSFQSLMQRFINFLEKEERRQTYAAKMGTNKPGVTLQITPKGWYNGKVPDQIDIDMIPLIKVGATCYVAKPPTGVAKEDSAVAHLMWRFSYSSQEAELWKSCTDVNLKKAVMIAKAIRQTNTHLRLFPSYFFKTIGMQLAIQVAKAKGQPREVEDRLIEIFQKLRDSAEAKVLKHAFRPDTNLLDGYTTPQLENVVSYLDSVLKTKLRSIFSFDGASPEQSPAVSSTRREETFVASTLSASPTSPSACRDERGSADQNNTSATALRLEREKVDTLKGILDVLKEIRDALKSKY